MISKTIDVVVTSVLQTTAGKMIFGRFIDPAMAQPGGAERDDRRSSRHGQAPASGSRPAATPAVDVVSDRPNGRAPSSGSVPPVAASPAPGGAVVQAPPVTGK
jgi:hypothetical protein